MLHLWSPLGDMQDVKFLNVVNFIFAITNESFFISLPGRQVCKIFLKHRMMSDELKVM